MTWNDVLILIILLPFLLALASGVRAILRRWLQLGGTAPTLSQRLAQLDEAKAAGHLTDEEYAVRRARIIAES